MADSFDTPTTRKPLHESNGGVSLTSLAIEDTSTPAHESTGRPVWTGPKPDSSLTDESFTNRQGRDSPAAKQLSGSAAAFQPGVDKPTPISMLNRDSTADDGRPTIVKSSAAALESSGKKSPTGAIGSGSRQSSPKTRDTFTTDTGPGVPFKGAHYLKLDQIPVASFDRVFKIFTDEYNWKSKMISHFAPEVGQGQSSKFISIYICFDDVADAAQAISDIEVVPGAQDWVPSYITQTEYAAKLPFDSGIQTSFFDGQVVFAAGFQGILTAVDASYLPGKVRAFAEDFGEILAFDVNAGSDAVDFRIEFTKISVARSALGLVTTAQPFEIEEWSVVARPVQGYPSAFTKPPSTPKKTFNGGREIFCSPTGRTSWSYGENGEFVIEQPMKTIPKVGGSATDRAGFTPAPRERWHSAPTPQTPVAFDGVQYGPRSGSWAGEVAVYRDTEPQCVSTERIANGQDVRTTIMLRNVPNRWTAADLKRILDTCSAGQYDFSYLRIDFEYNTNVGYAFVNFTDPANVIPFVDTYVGKEWVPGSFPRKIAAVSYATVQGYDCLVEKFRNSAIMDEYPGFRPKLWYTKENAPDPSKIGEEKAFPPPNNYSKKQRSHDNAGAIGLWAPRTGHRREGIRRSQYDRGTTRQIQEDAAYYQTGYGGQYIVGNGHGPVGAPPVQFTMPYYGGYTSFGPQVQYDFNGPYATPYFHPAGYPPPGTLVNPASGLRTISKGRLAGRPKNVTVDPSYYGGPVQSPNVPRSFNGEDSQYNGSYSNDARNYQHGAGHQYSPQY
ncbi:hypothetical protein MYCFIDRAFT_82251 [Lecanosticta acicola]|uniref:Mei2-like C-terminal RNA recognition motif domain-containing protein n=1 Tax=Lecanosticta acicola TaxID=111012 RepID=A0AAI8YW85_9PEZI|nr:hypothetical protein MYCFIDRAFT_82251 [Lecanosticta acicola]